MRKIIILSMLVIIFINGCNIDVSDNPYIEEIFSEPSFMDSTIDSIKIVYTIKNPSQIDFNGKLSINFKKECLSANEENQIEVKAESEKSGTISLRRVSRIKEECYTDQQVIFNLANEDGTILYDTDTIIIKLIE